MQILEPQVEGKLKFVLSEKDKERAKGRQVVLNGRYLFDEKGEMIVSAKDAAKMQRVLVRFFGCKLVALDDNGTELTVAADTIVAKVEKPSAPGSKQPAAAKPAAA
jgi:hypothetical protein